MTIKHLLEAIMSQIKQTNKRTGIEYVYESESYWDKNKKQSRYKPRKLIGHIDKATGELVPNRAIKARQADPLSKRLFCGTAHLLENLSQQIALAADLTNAFPGIARAIMSVSQYFLSEGSSTMARFSRWSRTHAHPLGQEMNSQQLSKLFESISQNGLEAFLGARIQRAGDEYWFYDTTSISSYSEFIESVRWGKNKDNVPLPQLNIAAVMDAGSKLPVYFKNIAGNINDVSMMRSLLADVGQLGAGRMRLCLDRGFYSKGNIDALMKEHMKFLIGLKTSYSYVNDAIEKHSKDLREWRNYDGGAHVFGICVPHEWEYEQVHSRTGKIEKAVKRAYLHLYYMPERAVKDEEELARLLKHLSDELEHNHRNDGHERLYERYFKRMRGGKIVGREEVIEAERAKFGYFALLSNDAVLSAKDALETYRAKDMIEKAFGDIKGRLDFRTPKVENTETLRGKLVCVFIALILACELRRRMSTANLYGQYTLHELLDELDIIERYECENHRPRVLAITKKQRDIYKAVGVEPLNVS
jgi:transposase